MLTECSKLQLRSPEKICRPGGGRVGYATAADCPPVTGLSHLVVCPLAELNLKVFCNPATRLDIYAR